MQVLMLWGKTLLGTVVAVQYFVCEQRQPEQGGCCSPPSAEGEASAAVQMFLDEITDPNAQQLPLWLAEMCAHLLWGFVPVDKEFCQLQEDSGFPPK